MAKKTALERRISAMAAYHGRRGSAKLPVKTKTDAPTGARATGTQSSRLGLVNVTAYIDPAVKQSLRLIQAKHPGCTVQDLLAEALNDLFSKYNVPQTAALQK